MAEVEVEAEVAVVWVAGVEEGENIPCIVALFVVVEAFDNANPSNHCDNASRRLSQSGIG